MEKRGETGVICRLNQGMNPSGVAEELVLELAVAVVGLDREALVVTLDHQAKAVVTLVVTAVEGKDAAKRAEWVQTFEAMIRDLDARKPNPNKQHKPTNRKSRYHECIARAAKHSGSHAWR
jgi:hypothetical protein